MTKHVHAQTNCTYQQEYKRLKFQITLNEILPNLAKEMYYDKILKSYMGWYQKSDEQKIV